MTQSITSRLFLHHRKPMQLAALHGPFTRWPHGYLRRDGTPDFPFMVRGRISLKTFGLKLNVDRIFGVGIVKL